MSMDCVEVAREQTRAECAGHEAGLQDAFGDPPSGAYFWPRRDQAFGCWTLQFCFDGRLDAHQQYATMISTRSLK